MKINKGFIGLGIIIAIVAILAVGGIAYYAGTKNNSTPNNVVENNLPQENQNNVVNTTVTNLNTTTSNTTATCTPSTIPWIKILSPNGGENYVLGQTINIKWDSKCIDSNKLVLINIGIKDSQAVSELLYNMKVANTGSYSFIIPSNYNLSGHISNKYEVAINYIYGNGDGVGDHSDAPFTINSSTVLTTYTYTNHGFSIELPKGYTPHEEQAEGGPATIISLPTGSLSYVSNSSFWEQYNIPSYTYIKNQKISDTTFKVYTYLGATFYWFKIGNMGYQFGGTDKTGLESLLKTFKYIGWPQTTLTQAQAYTLVLQTWGGCTPDSCGSVAVTVQNNNGQYTVTAIYEGLRDDSSSAQKKVALAYYNNNNNVWSLGIPTITQRCQPGRGHQDFSSALCY